MILRITKNSISTLQIDDSEYFVPKTILSGHPTRMASTIGSRLSPRFYPGWVPDMASALPYDPRKYSA